MYIAKLQHACKLIIFSHVQQSKQISANVRNYRKWMICGHPLCRNTSLLTAITIAVRVVYCPSANPNSIMVFGIPVISFCPQEIANHF